MTELKFNKDQEELLELAAFSELPIVVQSSDEKSRIKMVNYLHSINTKRFRVELKVENGKLVPYKEDGFVYSHKAILSVDVRRGKGIEQYHNQYYLIKVFASETYTPYFTIQVVTHKTKEETPTLKLTLKNNNFIAYTYRTNKTDVSIKYNKGTGELHNIRVNCETTLDYSLHVIDSAIFLYDRGKEISESYTSNLSTVLIFETDKLNDKQLVKLANSLNELEKVKAIGLNLVFESPTGTDSILQLKCMDFEIQEYTVHNGKLV